MHLKLVASIVAFLLTASSLCSQVEFTRGEITMEVTDIVLSPEIGADSTAILENLKSVNSELNLKYVFTEDVFSIIQIKEGPLGMDTILIVNDLVNLQKYFVQSIGYFKDTLIIPDSAPPFDVEIISEKKLDEKLFGLSQVEYTCFYNNQDTIVTVITEDLLMPSIAPSAPLNIVSKGTLLSIKMNVGVATVKYELTSFKTEIANKKYISTDFSQMQDLTETAKPFLDKDTEEEVWVAELEKEYGKYQPQGTNNDILIEIAKEGYITEKSIEYILEEKRDVDIPKIINILGSDYGGKIRYLAERTPGSIISDFRRWGLHSPSISMILSDTVYWSSVSDYDKVKVLKFASIHDTYMTERAKQQIIDNAKSIRFITDADESINQDFVKGKIGIDEWYGQFDTHSPLVQGKSKGIDDINSIVQYMFDEAFIDQPIEVAIGVVEDKIVIESKGAKHVLNVEKYQGEDAAYDITFYHSIVEKIKQVAADNGRLQGYSVYATEPLGPLGFDKYDYQRLIKHFPSLDYYEERLYLKKMIKKVYDAWAKLNMYFPYHPDVGLGEVSTFGPGHLIDVDFDIQYVTTANKLKFLKFQKEHAEIYRSDLGRVKKDSLFIMNNLISGANSLIRYLGPVKLYVSKVFPITPKEEYRKKFREDWNGLTSAYYSIGKVLNDDLSISNFRYDEEAHKENFMFEGKEYSIDPGELNMMRFIGNHIHKNKSGKKFYRSNVFSVTQEVYYYLLPEHVNVLKNMFNLPI